jgi:hypothetical protein
MKMGVKTMSKMGRPSKYKNEETTKLLQNLVYMYKKENPTGIVRIADMVRFSKDMNKVDEVQFPFMSKDVWSEYGRLYIDQANEPIRTELQDADGVAVDLPNISDIVAKYGDNRQKLLEYLLPVEQLLHRSIMNEKRVSTLVAKSESEKNALVEKCKAQQELLRKYEDFVLTMSHDSYRKEFEGQLVNQISVNANERNQSAMRNLNDLGAIFGSNEPQIVAQKADKQPSLLDHWKSKTKK